LCAERGALSLASAGIAARGRLTGTICGVYSILTKTCFDAGSGIKPARTPVLIFMSRSPRLSRRARQSLAGAPLAVGFSRLLLAFTHVLGGRIPGNARTYTRLDLHPLPPFAAFVHRIHALVHCIHALSLLSSRGPTGMLPAGVSLARRSASNRSIDVLGRSIARLVGFSGAYPCLDLHGILHSSVLRPQAR
jgi:hypothetical protein